MQPRQLESFQLLPSEDTKIEISTHRKISIYYSLLLQCCLGELRCCGTMIWLTKLANFFLDNNINELKPLKAIDERQNEIQYCCDRFFIDFNKIGMKLAPCPQKMEDPIVRGKPRNYRTF